MSDDGNPKLGLEVDSSGLERGTEKLGDFSDAAKEAGNSADKASDKFVGLGSSASGMGGKFKDSSDAAAAVAGGLQQTANAAKTAVSGFVGLGSSAADMGGKFTATTAAIVKQTEALTNAATAATKANTALKPFINGSGSGGNNGSGSGNGGGGINIPPLLPPGGGGGGGGGLPPVPIGISAETLGLITIFTAGVLTAAAAAGVLAYEWSKAQNEIQRSLIGIGATSGTTSAQINKFSTENATATGLSVSQAREAAIEFAKTGNIAVGQLKGLGDAVHGFSILTGQDATKATKTLAQALGGDLVKGAQELNKTYGFLNPAIEDNIRLLVNQGERTKAQQLIINAIEEDNKRAEETVNGLTVAWNFMANAADKAWNASKRFFGNGNRDSNLANLRNSPETKTLAEQQLLANDAAEKSAAQANSIQKSSDQIAMAADEVVKAYDPYIKKIQEADAALATLKAQQDRMNSEGGPVPGFAATFDDKGSGQAIANLRAAQTDLEGQAQRYNEQVAAISKSWGDVGQSTALSLNSMQNALPVAEAWTNSGKMLAQYQATYNELLTKGKTVEEAAALADGQETLSKAAAVASAQKLVQSSQDNLDKIKAQGTGMEGVLASSIAYRDAIASGATLMQANAIAANTLAASMAQAAREAAAMQNSIDQSTASYNASQVAAHKGSGTGDFVPTTMKAGASSFSADPSVNVSYKGGGGGFRIDVGQDLIAIQKLVAAFNDPTNTANRYVASGNYAGAINAIQTGSGGSQDDRMSLVDSLTQVMNGSTSDKGVQANNIKSELAWLQTLPETIARDQKINELTQSIDQLTGSTNNLNSTNQDLLSPYYTQDPRTSHIGFRSQGMASGGEFVVPGGYSANDNMIGTIPLASGEIVSVRRPGQSGGGGNTIHMNVTIAGNASKDEVKRTMYQVGQTMQRQLAAAGQ